MTLAVALAQWADFATFAVGVVLLGVGIESNPLMASAYSYNGLAAVAGAKLIAVAVVIRVLHSNFRWARQVAWLAVIAGVAASAVNVTAVLLI